jgi:hypothetical protein
MFSKVHAVIFVILKVQKKVSYNICRYDYDVSSYQTSLVHFQWFIRYSQRIKKINTDASSTELVIKCQMLRRFVNDELERM